MDEDRIAKLHFLARAFKILNIYMVVLFRLGMGRFFTIMPRATGRVMILVHEGRKSGKTRHTPVNYALRGGDVYCMAGFGSRSQWYRNIMANPQVEIWLPDGWWKGLAEDVTDAPDKLIILRTILINSGFASETFEGIDPRRISDEKLRNLMSDYDYRLLKISRIERRRGRGGPNDLAWVWLILLGIVIWWTLRPGQAKQ